MTGLEKIKDRILKEAEDKAQANIGRAETEVAEMLRSAEKEAGQKKHEIIEKAKKEAIEVKKRILAVAELEARKEKLNARQEIVEEAFSKALDRLCSMPDKEYEDMLVDMVVDLVETGNEEVLLSEGDKKRMTSQFVDQINAKLRQKGKDGSIRLSSQNTDIKGGFILKSGNIEINHSFEDVLRMRRNELEVEVFNVLF